MTNTKHTPGPWFQHRRYVSDKQSFAIEDNGTRVGETPNFIIDAEIEANAHLIAAAPDMDDVIWQAIVALNEIGAALGGNGTGRNPNEHDISEAIRQKDMVLKSLLSVRAKARGQSC